MSTRLIFIILALSITGVAISAIWFDQNSLFPILICCGVAALSLIWLYFRVITSNRAVQIGMDLLSAQDFTSRLRKVGERNADRVVALFNTMIDQLREERLKSIEQESLLSLLIDASPMGVAIMNYDGKLSRTNQAFLNFSGLKNDSSLVGKTPQEWPIIFSESLANLKLGDSEVVSTGDTMRYRCYHLNFMRQGFPIDFYLIESLTEEVREAERSAYEKVIRILSHEVNNTMCGVRSILGLIKDTISDDELNEAVESCDSRCDKLCGFVTSFADVVKLPQPDLKEIDLINELKKIMPFLRMMVHEGIELKTELPDAPIYIMADSIQLQQVMINIVKNAVESIQRTGYILIKVSDDKEGCRLEIINNGTPISNEVAANMFRPFYTNKPNGRGIGLTLVSEILTRHKTRFRLSTDPDGITRFRIVFPG